MKLLPEINLSKYYGYDEFRKHPLRFQSRKLERIIKTIEKEENIFNFREALFATIQIYFDGIIGSGNNLKEKDLREQKDTLQKLYYAGKKFTGFFYSGEKMDLDRIRKIFLPSASKILKYDYIELKARYLEHSYVSVQKFGLKLPEFLDGKMDFDSLVCIASGGFEPSFLVMYLVEKEDLITVRYSERRRDFEVRIPKIENDLVSKIKNKKVLVVDDWIDSGKTIKIVMNHIYEMEPRELYCTAVKNGYKYSKLLDSITRIINKTKYGSEADPFVCERISKTF